MFSQIAYLFVLIALTFTRARNADSNYTYPRDRACKVARRIAAYYLAQYRTALTTQHDLLTRMHAAIGTDSFSAISAGVDASHTACDSTHATYLHYRYDVLGRFRLDVQRVYFDARSTGVTPTPTPTPTPISKPFHTPEYDEYEGYYSTSGSRQYTCPRVARVA